MALSKCSVCGHAVPELDDRQIKGMESTNIAEAKLYSSKDPNMHYTRKSILVTERNPAGGDNNPLSQAGVKKNLKTAKSENCVTWARDRKINSPTKQNLMVTNNSESEIKSVNRRSDPQELKIGYRNENFADSQSDVETDNQYSEIKTSNEKFLKTPNESLFGSASKIPQRPLRCPDTECSRAVAVESLTSHFYFDHSKVPLLTLQTTKVESVVLNVSLLSYGTSRCIAFFLIPDNTRYTTSKVDTYSLPFCCNSNLALPLMASKVPIHFPHSADEASLSRTSSRNCSTWKYDIGICTETTSNEVGVGILQNERINLAEPIAPAEVVVLWLCGIDGNQLSYSITLRDLDCERRYSHSYTGSVYSLRAPQDGLAVLRKAQCLVVQGAAVNILLSNSPDQLAVDIVIH